MYTWHVTHGAASDIGLSRHHNEDRFHADPAAGLFIVCDGMGGHRAGEVVSSRTIALIPQHIAAATADPTLPLVGRARHDCSVATNDWRVPCEWPITRSIRKRRTTRPMPEWERQWSRRGSWGRSSRSHVGDSRLYLIRNKTIQLLTRDHSLVQEQVRSGLLTDAEALRAAHTNMC